MDGMCGSDDIGSPEWRCRLIAEVTLGLLRDDPELTLCEGLRLVEAARTAVERLEPSSRDVLLAETLPRLRRVLLERFGIAPEPGGDVN